MTGCSSRVPGRVLVAQMLLFPKLADPVLAKINKGRNTLTLVVGEISRHGK